MPQRFRLEDTSEPVSFRTKPSLGIAYTPVSQQENFDERWRKIATSVTEWRNLDLPARYNLVALWVGMAVPKLESGPPSYTSDRIDKPIDGLPHSSTV